MNYIYTQGQNRMVHWLSNLAAYWNHLGALKNTDGWIPPSQTDVMSLG